MKTRRSLALGWLAGALLSVLLAACAPAPRPAATPTTTTPPTAAPTVAATPTTAAVPISVIIEHQADGSSVVRDVGNAYQFTLSKDWTAIPVSEEHVERATQASPRLDEEFLRLARKLSDERKDAFRLIGINTDSKLASAENPTLLLVTAIPDRISAALPMPELARMIQDTVFSESKPADMQQNVVQNANGLSVAVVEGPYAYYSTQGDTFSTRSKVFGFQANSRVVLIQFITPAELGAEVLPGTDQILDSIQRFRP